MKVDYLIIGQGISGTFLSYYLAREGKKIMVIDNARGDSPSRVAAGIINPVTGRRIVNVWMADEIIPFAHAAYHELGAELGVTAITRKSIIDFFPNPFMRESFLRKIEEDGSYVHSFPEQNHFNSWFHYEFGCGEIRPAYIAHLENILPAWSGRLEEAGQLRTEDFNIQFLEQGDETIRYKDIEASAIIFCDGSSGFESRFFRLLPFSPNKGEALVLEIPGLPNDFVYKKSLILAPFGQPDIFWLGSVYQWEFTHEQPTPEFRKYAGDILNAWLRIPYKVLDHRAAVRPATIERRPFAGMHPLHKNIGLLNGMGTKGCSLAPYFAKQLCDHLVYKTAIHPEADIARFRRLLTVSGH